MPRIDGPGNLSSAAGAAPAARVVLYGRPGCHLCDEAREVVRAVCDELAVGWREIDVDAAPTPPGGRPLAQEYGELVPVVEVDGVRRGYWRIDAGRLRRALLQADVSAGADDRP